MTTRLDTDAPSSSYWAGSAIGLVIAAVLYIASAPSALRCWFDRRHAQWGEEARPIHLHDVPEWWLTTYRPVLTLGKIAGPPLKLWFRVFDAEEVLEPNRRKIICDLLQ